MLEDFLNMVKPVLRPDLLIPLYKFCGAGLLPDPLVEPLQALRQEGRSSLEEDGGPSRHIVVHAGYGSGASTLCRLVAAYEVFSALQGGMEADVGGISLVIGNDWDHRAQAQDVVMRLVKQTCPDVVMDVTKSVMTTFELDDRKIHLRLGGGVNLPSLGIGSRAIISDCCPDVWVAPFGQGERTFLVEHDKTPQFLYEYGKAFKKAQATTLETPDIIKLGDPFRLPWLRAVRL